MNHTRLITRPDQITDRNIAYRALPPFSAIKLVGEEYSQYDIDFVSYHWNDRGKLEKDYPLLTSRYEELLQCLVRALNSYHDEAKPTRYWRIIIGVWLYNFVGLVFDRWETIEIAFRENPLAMFENINYKKDEFIVKNATHHKLAYGIEYNAFIYSEIVSFLYPQRIITKNGIGSSSTGNHPHDPVVRSSEESHGGRNSFLKQLLIRLFGKNQSYFIYQAGISRKNLVLLNLMLKQIPVDWAIESDNLQSAQLTERNRLKINCSKEDAFLLFMARFIEKIIPIPFLEGYKSTCRHCRGLPWPKKPKVIFSTTGWNDNIFNFWSAEKVREGAILVGGQHGGGPGIEKLQISEEHQVEISDKFLTWGWSDARKKVVPCLALGEILKGTRYSPNTNGGVILVMTVVPEVTVKVAFNPLGPTQSRMYLEGQFQFIGHLSPDIRGQLTVRLLQKLEDIVNTDYSTSLRRRYSGLELDPSLVDIAYPINRSRLYVESYRGTGYLKTLSSNFPTVIFWNTALWQFRDSALMYFDLLKEVGIFHDNPEAAANHVNTIWNNVSLWWNSDKVQEARKIFCERYAHGGQRPLQRLAQEILN